MVMLSPKLNLRVMQKQILTPGLVQMVSTLTDHLMWQLGAMSVTHGVREAAELIIGNLNEEGYLTASDEELMLAALPLVHGVRPLAAVAESEPEPEPQPESDAL